jgi:hypothetical protein
MGQMGLAIHKLSTLEGFVRQVSLTSHYPTILSQVNTFFICQNRSMH